MEFVIQNLDQGGVSANDGQYRAIRPPRIGRADLPSDKMQSKISLGARYTEI